jgi:tight adherence protein B
VRTAAAADGDVGAALAAGAAEPGAAELQDVAACWQVAERTGAGLGGALAEVAAAADERSAHRARVHAQSAGVRTTGWLLAALPLVGMGLAAAAGAHPWRVLLGTPSGFALLLLGLGLDAAGVLWLHRMARRVEVLA